jgi:hypothetical protein
MGRRGGASQSAAGSVAAPGVGRRSGAPCAWRVAGPCSCAAPPTRRPSRIPPTPSLPLPPPQSAPSLESSHALPAGLIFSALHHLTAARGDVARLSQELEEIKNSRVAHVPPSAWVKREHKYKQDHEKFEHTIAMQRQRMAKLEAEVAVLREGASIRPLEERIQVGGPARGCVGPEMQGLGSCGQQAGGVRPRGLRGRVGSSASRPLLGVRGLARAGGGSRVGAPARSRRASPLVEAPPTPRRRPLPPLPPRPH